MNLQKMFDVIYRYYPVVINSLVKITGIIYNLIQTAISSIGAIVILVTVLIVEHHRFSLALATFEPNATYTFFGASFLVASILFNEVQSVVIERQHNYHRKDYVFSLSLLRDKFKYFFGLGEFVPVEKSPSHEINSLKRNVIFIALMLAMFGSLNEQIKLLPEDMIWYDGYAKIFFGGNTESMTAVLTVLMFTYASILVGGKAASEVTKRAIDVLDELENKRREKLQEEQKKHILPVKNINPTISRVYSVYTSHAKIKDGDMIDITKNDFYDSVNERWLKDGEGYSNATTLIKNIEKVLSKRV